MFEPLPSFVRMRREQRNLTQQQLARLAKVSRGQLIAFEKGEQNVSLLFLMKIARALEMTELPLAELNLRPPVPELTVLMAAVQAIALAEGVVAQAAGAAQTIQAASSSVSSLLEQAMTLGHAHSALVASASRVMSAAPVETLREVAESPHALPRRRSAKAAAKPAARKRAR